MSEQSNLKIVQDNYAAFGKGDLETFFGNLSEDVVWESRYSSNVPFGGTFQGKSGIQDFLSVFDSSASIQAFAPLKFLASEDIVVVIGYEELTAKPTGRSYRNDWIHVFTLVDGKVIKIQTSNDTATVEAAFQG